MPIRAQLETNGELKLSGNINTRMPAVTSGLVHLFSFDGKGGAFDSVNGIQTTENIESKVNLVEAMENDWRDPSSWSSSGGMVWDETNQAMKITGYHNSWLKTPIIVQTDKTYHVSMEIMEEVQSGTGLYLGGYDTNELKERVTSNYDYTFAANAQPTTGVWTTYRVTRSGLGGITSRTSTTFDNVAGWTGNRTGLTGTLVTKYYHLGGLFNYSTGGVMYIRNLTITIEDEDTSNTVITNSGVAVKPAGTNVFRKQVLESGGTSPHSISLFTGSTLNKGYLDPFGTYLATRMVGGTNPAIRYGTTDGSNSADITSGKTYTFSIYAKLAGTGAKPSVFQLDVADRGNTNQAAQLTYEWKRFSQVAVHDNNANYGFADITINTGAEIMLSHPQIEENTVATEWTEGSWGSGEVKIPVDLTDTCTIMFDYKYDGKVSSTVISNDQFEGIWWGAYINSSGYIYQHEGSGGSSNSPNTVKPPIGEWCRIIIKWHATFQELWVDGVYLGQVATNGAANSARIPFIYLGNGWNRGSGTFKNLTIYNRNLTTPEVQLLSKGNMNLQTTGDLFNKINTSDRVGWTKVYDGLCSQLMSETVHDGENLDYYDINLEFDQVLVRAKHWDAEEIQELTETCRMERSMKYYARWLDLLPDEGAPQVKFHGLDGVQDVGFINASKILFGYGNSWRRIAPLLPYVSGTTSHYLGSMPSTIVNEDWEAVHGGSNNYANYMHLNYPNETGTYKLTPRQAQSIEIYVRMKPTKESKMEVLDRTVQIKHISTQEVL